MPRRIPVQVTQTVSRLLEGGYVKKPPAWYEPTLRHPPALVPPRQSRERPDSDLPRALQREAREALTHRERPHMNSRKKLRSLEGLEPAVRKRRLYGFLARRGFAHDEISRVMRALDV